jgi:protein-tyrosine-phosphatase
MIIHFICRGNSFRSIIAEAYLNSLQIKDWKVLSSGTTAASDKERNLPYYRMTLDLLEEQGIREFAKAGYGDQLTQAGLEEADITVCMNQRVYDECLRLVTFPVSPQIWSVADIGEPGRISNSESERKLFRKEAFQQIIKNVDRLVSGTSAASAVRPGEPLPFPYRRTLAGYASPDGSRWLAHRSAHAVRIPGATEFEGPAFGLYGGWGSRVSPVWARNPSMRAGRYWIRLSRFLMIAASWSTSRAARLPRPFFMFAQAPSAALSSGA